MGIIDKLMDLGLDHEEAVKIGGELAKRLDDTVTAMNTASRNAEHWTGEYERLKVTHERLTRALASDEAAEVVPLHVAK